LPQLRQSNFTLSILSNSLLRRSWHSDCCGFGQEFYRITQALALRFDLLYLKFAHVLVLIRVEGKEGVSMPAPARLSADEGKQRQRKIYIRSRIPEIRKEVKDLHAEKKDIPKKIQGSDPNKIKQLTHRKIFLSLRIDELREELNKLVSEGKVILSSAKSARVPERPRP
jgi:hypothetical protein